MRNFTYLMLVLLFALQNSYSQEKYSRVRISNPTQNQVLSIQKLGIDLNCGSSHHNHDLIVEISDREKLQLEQRGISYTVLQDDLTSFYAERASNELPRAKALLKAEKARATNIAKSSVSNVVFDNAIQYTGCDEIDWAVPSNFNFGSMGGCLTLSEMKAELDNMYTYSQSNSLNIVSQKQDASPTNQTTWGNPSGTITNNGLTYSGQGTTRWNPETIWYVRITGNEDSTPEGTKPQILFTSMIHSRELSALMNNIYFMWYIIENYETDDAIKELVDNNELYFVPVVNPDGLRWNEHLSPGGGGMQRKNLRPNTGPTTNTTPDRGVDLNRNFDYYWGLNNIGSSGTQSSGTYRGPSPASEPETQIMVDFISSRNFETGVWNHSFTNSLPHPYGGVPTLNSGREDEFHRWHEEMSRYNRYLYGATIFYESNGIPDDWMLGGAPDNNGSTGFNQAVLATTPEHGGSSEGGFWPSLSNIVPIAKRSMRVSLATAYYGGKYAKLHDLTQSDISSLNSNLDFGIERIGQADSDFTVTVTPVSTNIVSINSPATQTGIAVLEQRSVTATLELDPGISPNDKIEYNVKLINDNGIIYEANFEKYYQPTVLFNQNPDNDGLTGWTQSGGWATTTADAYSGSTSINTGTYSTNNNKTLTTASSYDFSNSSEVSIQFYTKWDIERNYDYVEFLASPDGGSNWVTLCGKYTKPNATSFTTNHDNKSGTFANFQNNSGGQIYDADRMDNWVMEEYVIDNTYASILNSSNVRLRFNFRTDGANVMENYTSTLDGFFIDDFKIISIEIPCVTTVPTALSSSSILDISATVNWDDVPSATYDLRYRETGTTTWSEVTDINTNSYVINGLTELTEYEVQVRTRCTSSTSAYTSSLVFTTLDVITCTGTLVDSFPYLETFDSGLGDWTQASGDDGDWSLNGGTTPSTGTGPSNDITGGGQYFYTEASTTGLGFNATVILNSPCFSLTNLSNAELSFYYHMLGANLGTLSVELSNDDGTNWTNVFTQTGGSEDLWKVVNVDLSGYLGQQIKLRFIGTTGGGWSSDIAIDHVSIREYNYCASNGNSTNDEFINRVQLNTLDNNNSGVGTSGTGYSDFSIDPNLNTTLLSGTQYTITITPQWTGTAYAEGYSVWIDYNRDGDLLDAGEQVWTQAPTSNATVSGSFTIPSTVSFGNTLMRVSMKYNAIPTACESFDFGEVEDYTVNIGYDGLLFSNNSWTPSAPNGTTGSVNVLILDGTFNANANFEVNDLTVNTGATLNLDKANAITVNGNVAANGNLVLNSDSNEFSSLLVTGNVSGDVKYHRHVNSNADDNDLIAPPVSGETFVDFLTNNSNVFANGTQTLFLFGDFAKPSNQYQLYSNTETANLVAGKGYRAASTDDGTFEFTGTVTTSDLVVPIERTGTTYTQWNLIGNPYTSYIRLSDFLTTNIGELDPSSAAVYGYDADDSNGSNWAIWNFAYSDANPGSLIAPGQGFFVSARTGSNVNITFESTMRTAGNSDDFIAGRNNTSTIAHSVFEIVKGSESYETELYFTDNASAGLDLGYDAEHFGGAPSDFSIYTELAEDNTGTDIAVQSISFNDVSNGVIIPVGLSLNQGEQATIRMTNSDASFDIFLEDTQENTFTLLNNSEYTFTANSDMSDIGRFYLRFNADVLSTNESSLERIQIYNDNDLEEIIIKGQLNSKTALYLYDIQGREILNAALDMNNSINKINTTGFAIGVYLVKLENNLTTITKKLVIK